MKVYLFSGDECSVVSIDQGLETCRLKDLSEAACVAFGQLPSDQVHVTFHQLLGGGDKLNGDLRLTVACCIPPTAANAAVANGFLVMFSKRCHFVTENDSATSTTGSSTKNNYNTNINGITSSSSSLLQPDDGNNGDALLTTATGRCASCLCEFSFPAERTGTVSCTKCTAENVVVRTVNRQAECSNCHLCMMYRLDGSLLMQCSGCGDRSMVGQCSGCGLEFVYREREAAGLTELPCPDPECSVLTPVVRDRRPDPVTRRLLVPLLTVATADQVARAANAVVVAPPSTDARARFHVIAQFYRGSNTPSRQLELERALVTNLCNPLIRSVHLFVTAADKPYVDQKFGPYLAAGQLKLARPLLAADGRRRLTFHQAFAYACTELAGQLCIIANTDICFDSSLKHVDVAGLENRLLALSRYEHVDDTDILFNQFLAPMSQDAWLFLAEFDQSFRSFVDLNFELGRMGSDNRIVYEFERAGVHLSNPCFLVSIRHLHAHRDLHLQKKESQENSVPGPYKLLSPNKSVI